MCFIILCLVIGYFIVNEINWELVYTNYKLNKTNKKLLEENKEIRQELANANKLIWELEDEVDRLVLELYGGDTTEVVNPEEPVVKESPKECLKEFPLDYFMDKPGNIAGYAQTPGQYIIVWYDGQTSCVNKEQAYQLMLYGMVKINPQLDAEFHKHS
jgi:hypothetical protein